MLVYIQLIAVFSSTDSDDSVATEWYESDGEAPPPPPIPGPAYASVPGPILTTENQNPLEGIPGDYGGQVSTKKLTVYNL